ncbi:MAG TPA: hypothetical protein VNW71_14340 [Thermoanaerobaculia bacterium]|nr:hypothetical protein [Thermoanaerobaculia bacterium]
MARPALGMLALLLALSAIPAAAAPLQITGKILNPPKDVQVELRLRAGGGDRSLRVLDRQAEGFAPAESRVVVAPGGTVRLEIALGVL